MSDALFDGKKFRVLTLVDNYSRRSLAIHCGISIKGENVAEILKNVTFEQQASPKRIKIDNGSEFISKALDRWTYEKKIELEFSRPGKPTDNAFIESFNRSLRDECLNVNWFLSLEDAQQNLDVWREDYNSYRPHSSLGNLTPNEFINNSQKKTNFSTLDCSIYRGEVTFILSWSEAIREELKDTGITVTALLPGPTDTDFFNKALMNESKMMENKDDFSTAEEVAKDGYKALINGDHSVVSGLKNKFSTGDLALALLPYVKFPTSDYEDDSRLEGGLIVPMAYKLPGDWNLGFQVEVDRLKDKDQPAMHTKFLQTLTFSHPLLKGIDGIAETYYTYDFKSHEISNFINAAIQMEIVKDFKLDVGFNYALQHRADKQYFIGASCRL